MIRGAQKWLLPLLKRQRELPKAEIQHVFLAVCDHFEPMHRTDAAGALARLSHWRAEYPRMAAKFRDSSGRGPRHTFFYPIEQHTDEHVRIIADICRATGSEIEVQLHHDGDTEESLAEKIEQGVSRLVAHGCLAADREGRRRFGFVHGNWALCNSRPDGRWCGVPREISLLRKLGCYGDFTFPSAPSLTQPRSVNQIGYARELGSSLSLDSLADAEKGKTRGLRSSDDHLLIVQGPLALNWSHRKWGLLPRLENADLTAANPPRARRLGLWMSRRIHVAGRPDWVFIKLHSHGALPESTEALLGPVAEAFHRHFTSQLPGETGIQAHYVTAREMANLIHAAEDDSPLPPEECLDHWLRPPATAER